MIAAVEWRDILVPETPVVEIVVRGSLTYLGLFVLLRFLVKRGSSGVSLSDLLVVVLMADAAQNAMAGSYTSVPDGLLLVSVIVAWDYALDWLGYHIAIFERLVHPRPNPVVKDGEALRRNLRWELMTMDELMSQLREQGVDDISRVKEAYVEGDGRVSVVTFDQRQHRGPREGGWW